MNHLQGLYTVRDVARIFNLHESRVRYWAQTGFINPSGQRGGKRLYSFTDLIGIKTAKDLLDRGIPLQRVRKNLQALREALPSIDQPLSQLRVRSDGDRLIVADREGFFDPLSGQLILDFDVEELDQRITQITELPETPSPEGPHGDRGSVVLSPPRTAPAFTEEASAETEDRSHPRTAYDFFLKGCSLDSEPSSSEEAIRAYKKALELDPTLASAHTNLGNVYHRRGDHAKARQCYQDAIMLDPDQPEACYNLANLCEEEGDLEMAVTQHRRALLANPDFADAHFNLALALETLGHSRQALHHWRSYLDLFPAIFVENEWQALAKEHMQRLAKELQENGASHQSDS